MKIRHYYLLSFMLLVSFSGELTAQDTASKKDTVLTPFRKGRWLTNLSGNVGTGTNALPSIKTFSNRYNLNFASGKFSKDRLLFGMRINFRGEKEQGFSISETESFYIGPSTSYYFSKSKSGSLFLSLSAGYVRFRNEVEITQNSTTTIDKLSGQGVGGIILLGYSYVVFDRISFDLTFDVNFFEIWADRTLEPMQIKSKERLSVSGVALNFGFSVLLDQFFF